MKQEILENTTTFSTAEVARILGLTADGVRKRRLAGRLLALPVASDFRYRAWQFSKPASRKAGGGDVLSGLEDVLAALRVENPWVRFELLTTPIPDAGWRSVLELLRSGDKDAALQGVALYGKHAA